MYLYPNNLGPIKHNNEVLEFQNNLDFGYYFAKISDFAEVENYKQDFSVSRPFNLGFKITAGTDKQIYSSLSLLKTLKKYAATSLFPTRYYCLTRPLRERPSTLGTSPI